MFDYTKHQSLGCIETGEHSVYFFEVYKVNEVLTFIDHDDPSEPMSYEEVSEVFKMKGDITLKEQLQKLKL